MARLKLEAPKKRRKTTKKKKTWFDKSVKVGVEGIGAGGIGAIHGAVEELYGAEASGWYRLGTLLTGAGGLLLLDEAKHPHLTALARMGFYGAATLEGDKQGRSLVRSWNKYNEERSAAEAEKERAVVTANLEQLRAQVAELEGALSADAKQRLLADMGSPTSGKLNGIGEPADAEVTVPKGKDTNQRPPV